MTFRRCGALQISGSPLVVGSNILVMGRASKQAAFEDCYVLCFDLESGKYRWNCYIASANTVNVPWAGGPAMLFPENTSHLAYADGRVYVLTNLGALAALDAYNGSIAWLDIYPTRNPAGMNPNQPFVNPWLMQQQMQQNPPKPWTFNPVIVAGGKVFALPGDSDDLLIYDAGTGAEVKRIPLKDLADCNDLRPSDPHDEPLKFDTLLAVDGEQIILAGDRHGLGQIVSFDWQHYAADRSGLLWASVGFQDIRGRCFVTRDSVFVPTAEHLVRVERATGKCADYYPQNDRSWDEQEGEGPGNVLVTSDHVVLAGPKSVDVYTDLTAARAKLDREVAAAPNDALPRLRYAEVMFVSGQTDAATKKLDEAIQLLGGPQAMQPGPGRDQAFIDALTFAEKLTSGAPATANDVAVKLFDRAELAAASPTQKVQCTMSRARYAESIKDPAGAVELYQRVLSDGSLRAVAYHDEHGDSQPRARGGPAVDRPPRERRSIGLRPLPTAGGGGLGKGAGGQRRGTCGIASGSGADATPIRRPPRRRPSRLPTPTKPPAMEGSPSRSCVTCSSATPTQRSSRASWKRWPAIICSEKTRGWTTGFPRPPRRSTAPPRCPATCGCSVRCAFPTGGRWTTSASPPPSRRCGRYRGQEVAKSLPDFHLPVPRDVDADHWPQPFAAAGPDDVVAETKGLVVPIRDFSRADRVVTWSTGGELCVYPAGRGKPLAKVAGFGEQPRNSAWVGNGLLVWGPAQLALLQGDGAGLAWKLAIKELPAVEIARFEGEQAPFIPDNNLIADGVVINVVPPQVVVRGNRGQFLMRGGGGMVVQQLPAAQPNPPPARNGEEIIEVRPVGDRVLITTSAGRIASADMNSGRLAWQARLSDRAVDRLVANEDFAVVRVNGEASVRLVSFDTYSGRMLGSRAFIPQSGAVPVNMALAADGTLVYTLPDRLCLKDLYKPWNDPADKEVMGPQGTAIFRDAKGPDQLIIAEGRILALADDGTQPNPQSLPQKLVRVHSLETGQPVPLKYKTPQGDQEIDRILAAGKDWGVSLRVVGSHLYVVGGSLGISGYDLDHPARSWTPPPGSFEKLNVRDAFIGRNHVVLLDEQAAANNGAPSIYSLYAFARYPGSQAGDDESGRIDYDADSPGCRINSPAGVAASWQATDGGFYYLTGDNTLHMLRGAGQGR